MLSGFLLAGGLTLAPERASAGSLSELTPHEQRLVVLINQARAGQGLATLAVAAGATDVARGWAGYMARSGDFRHNPQYVSELRVNGQSNATRFAENVAYGYRTADEMFNAYMNSSGHRANILSAGMRLIGIGSVRNSNGAIYNTMNFIDREDGSRPSVRSGGDYFGGSQLVSLVGARSGGLGEFNAPWSGGTPLACDWDGDGIDTIGFFRQGIWRVPADNAANSATRTFAFGNPGDQPLCGDWNRDGVDSIAVYRAGTVFLRDANSSGAPSTRFSYGNAGDVAFAGDFNGDGWDSIGIKRGSAYYLANRHVGATAEVLVYFGNPSDRIMTGDFDRNGTDTLALQRAGTFYLSNNNASAAVTSSFGNASDVGFIGDFDGNNADDKGIFRA